MMEGQKVVKVFCHEKESIEKFNELNEELFNSANNANGFANILMPINNNLGNLGYVVCAIFGSILAIGKVGSFTLGGLASFLQLNKSFTQPISQVSQQLNAVVMALAGAERVFNLMDEKPEVDDGCVTLVNAKEDKNGNIEECEEHTGVWAWKYPRKDGSTTLTNYKGMWYLMMWTLGIMKKKQYFTILNYTQNLVKRLPLLEQLVQEKLLLQI